MPNPLESRKNELPTTYFVQDRQSQQELVRLTLQDRLLTTAMGGVLPEQPDPSSFQRVLDIGSGSGSWVIEAAQTYPAMSLVGIDIGARMVEYARAQAAAQKVADRAEFRVMDALRTLDFPDASFDLVNLRLGVSFLRTWDWPRVIGEMLRVTRSGGLIRLTDQEMLQAAATPSFRRCNEMFLCAFFRSGHLFTQESTGLTAHLEPMLKRYGCQLIGTKAYELTFRSGTPEGQAYCDNMAQVFKTAYPFLQKWGCATTGDDMIYQQALNEMQQPDFDTTWRLLSVWGTRP